MASKKVDENSDQNHKSPKNEDRDIFIHSTDSQQTPNEHVFKETCRTDMTVC